MHVYGTEDKVVVKVNRVKTVHAASNGERRLIAMIAKNQENGLVALKFATPQ